MDLMDSLTAGLAAGFQPYAFMLIVFGVVAGILVGAAPGMGPTVGMAIALPFVLSMSSEHAIFVLVSILIGANFGNAIPAVLIHVPGTPNALLTAIEGHPMLKRGEGAKALMIALVASTIGQLIGVVLFILFVVPLAKIAIKLLYPEIFAVIVFGLLAAVGLTGANIAKGLVSIALGLLLGIVGPDPVTTVPRLDFGVTELSIGLDIVPLVVGLLALQEVFKQAGDPIESAPHRMRPVLPKPWEFDIRPIWAPLLVGALIGTAFGILPGAGATAAMFVSYAAVRFVSKHKDMFGKGSEEALAGVEASNNAAAAGELVPTFGLGIPGGAPMVVLMAALTAQGVFVGPSIMQTQPQLLYSVFGGLLVATMVMAVVGYLLIWPSVYVGALSKAASVTLTLVLVVIGIYALRWSMFDVWVTVGMAMLGYAMTRLDYPIAPAALAIVLGYLLEKNLRVGLIMTDGFTGFVSRPITAALLGFAVLSVAVPVVMTLRRRHRQAKRGPEIGTN